MSDFDEIMRQVPVSQLASQWGVDESEVTQAAQNALPALLGGLHANAQDPAGANSIVSALSQHQGQVSSLDDVDENDGQKIVGNIFGGNANQVVNQLGGLGGTSSSMVSKLLPILAPIVMSWLAQKMSGSGGLGGMLGGAMGGQSPQASGGVDSGPLFPGGQGASSGPAQVPGGGSAQGGAAGSLQDILGSVLGGGASGGGTSGSPGGDILGGLLGGLLGGGKR